MPIPDNEPPFEFDVLSHRPDPQGPTKVAIGSIPAGQIMSAANARALAAALTSAADAADTANA